MKTPTWGQIERFCRIDGWHEVRRSGHVHFEKILADDTVLRTHRSFSSRKTMSPGRFKAILRYQLLVTEEQFWHALEVRRPVDRCPNRTPTRGVSPLSGSVWRDEAGRRRRTPH